MTDPRASMETLRQTVGRYRRGEADRWEVRRALDAACEQGHAQVLEEIAAAAGLSEVAYAALLDTPSPAATNVGEATLLRPPAPLDADATRLAAAETVERPDCESGATDRTRLTAEPARIAEGSADIASTTDSRSRSEWSWSKPARWRETRDGPLGPGSVLKERFVLEELIGHGGMGAVYRARDLRQEEAQDRDPHVALKLLNDDFREHPDALIALQREARKTQTLAHPNIVNVHDFDRDGTTVFVSMELMRGQPLDAVIRGRGAFGLPRKEALQLIDRMARGLAYAHQEGFVHADFKPGNVFLNEGGSVKVLDFGLARAAKVPRDNGAGDDTRFDPASLGAITPAYASTEMLRGNAAEPADDVYALACTAYELLTGHHPFLDESGRKLPADQAAQRGMQPQPLRGVPKRVNRAVLRGLAFERSARFADAGEFLDAVKEPVRLRRTILAAIVLLAVATGASWWITYRGSSLNVSLDSLSVQVAESKEAILQGDTYRDRGEIPQAYEAYALAWQKAKARPDIDAGALSDLRVVVDRRVNSVIDYYVQRAREPDLDAFTAEVLRLTLESLGRQELGSRGASLRDALQRLNERLASKERP